MADLDRDLDREAERKAQELKSFRAKQARAKLSKLLKKQGVLDRNRETNGIPVTSPAELASAIAAETRKELEAESAAKGSTSIPYNEKQQQAIDLVLSGKSCVITGPAGSGKTTTVKGIVNALMENNLVPPVSAPHKHLKPGTPSLACVSFTNKAVQNLKHALSEDLRGNCITIHKALEFEPVFSSTYDLETGKDITSMEFLPKRDVDNPLMPLILIIDEATMVSVELWNLLAAALKSKKQIIIMGDINQLPPVFGKSIFVWAMQLGCPTVELTHIYRQALQSPIIRLATRVREGKIIRSDSLQDFAEIGEHGNVTIRPWKKAHSEVAACRVMGKFLPELIDSGAYDPIADVILTPFNKSFGTVMMNDAIASHLAQIETNPTKKAVWEIYAGIAKKYLRIGDKVLYQKSEAIITNIETNGAYYGKHPRPPSPTMSYNGVESDPEIIVANHGAAAVDEADSILANMESHLQEGAKVSREASHKITVYVESLEQSVELTGSGELNAMDLAYAITVHKSQGSEYRRVFFITHKSQQTMLFRELIYTAVTRASEELYIICEPDMFVKGLISQRVPGDTLEEKLENFDKNLKTTKAGQSERPAKVSLLVSADKEAS